MPALNLFNHPGQKGVDPDREKALLVGWMLLTTNAYLSAGDTRIVRTNDELEKVLEEGAASKEPVHYIDLRDLYPTLSPLTEAEVDQLVSLAGTNAEINATAATFWSVGESLLRYTDHYCLAVTRVLSFNT